MQRQHQELLLVLFSKNSEGTDVDSCFDIEDKGEGQDNATSLIDPNTNVNCNKFRKGTLGNKDKEKDYLAEYYLRQEEDFDKAKLKEEDYSDSSCLLLDYVEEQFTQYIVHIFYLLYFCLSNVKSN